MNLNFAGFFQIFIIIIMALSKLPPIPCSGWCYTEAEDDIVYDYAWTIEKFSRTASNYRTGLIEKSSLRIFSIENFLQGKRCIQINSRY